MEQMIANGIQLIKTNASYVFDSDTVFYRNEIPFVNQANEYDITDCHYAQPIDFTDLSVLQFLSVEASLSCDVLDYLGNVLTTIAAVNVGTYDTQNVFNLEIDWSAITGNLEQCYLQITDGTEYFKSEPLRMIILEQRIKLRYRMLRNHKSIGYFFNADDDFYTFYHILYAEAAITDFKKEITKSVFEDSNQTLLNLFSNFRHSFLLKTFQIAYYMYEKVSVLSLCDEILLSEVKASQEYEGRIFLSKDETPEVEIIDQTNLYISSTRFVVDKAFRLVGAAQEIPLPTPGTEAQGVIPIHHTEKTGRKSTFQTPYLLLAGKTLYTPQGNPNEYLFKIGGVTDNYRNSHDVAWDIITSNTFAEFALLEVPVDSHILVRYTGALTQTDIVSTLYSSISNIPLNPSTRTITPSSKTAASDLMIYPKLVTGFDSVGFSSGAATLFSQQRTFAELANSSDLTDYNPGIVNLAITQEDGIGHLFLERTNTTPLVANITTNQADTTREIIAYATPLNNEFYPTTADGTNPPAINFDRINDYSQANNQAFCDFINMWNLPVGTQRSFIMRMPTPASTRYLFQAGRTSSGNGFTNGTTMSFLGSGKYQAFITVPSSETIKTIIWNVERPPVYTGVDADIYDYVKCYVNGRELTAFNLIEFDLASDPLVNDKLGNYFTQSAFDFARSVRTSEFYAVLDRFVTEEEAREITLSDRETILTGYAFPYAWDYSQIVNGNEIKQVGTTVGAPNLTLFNHDGSVGNLFL